jgi:hypothetical protein
VQCSQGIYYEFFPLSNLWLVCFLTWGSSGGARAELIAEVQIYLVRQVALCSGKVYTDNNRKCPLNAAIFERLKRSREISAEPIDILRIYSTRIPRAKFPRGMVGDANLYGLYERSREQRKSVLLVFEWKKEQPGLHPVSLTPA